MKTNQCHIYNDLAWTENILAPPQDYEKDTELFSNLIKKHSRIVVNKLLHLGCGAGGNDFSFKKNFKVTGIDISKEMLKIARKLNPEVKYIYGDMRTVRLKESFDAVAIPDSISYLKTIEDLQRVILNSYKYLKPGGVLLIVTITKEEFKENNFVYTGSRGNINITLFENNYMNNKNNNSYQATFIYLIRKKGELELFTDCHVLGLFKRKTWFDLLKETGFKVKQMKLKDAYARYILGEGEYPLSIFICSKPIQ